MITAISLVPKECTNLLSVFTTVVTADAETGKS